MALEDYLRERFFPHMWCPGCGHGIVLNGLVRAVEMLGLKKNELVMVSGIGRPRGTALGFDQKSRRP